MFSSEILSDQPKVFLLLDSAPPRHPIREDWVDQCWFFDGFDQPKTVSALSKARMGGAVLEQSVAIRSFNEGLLGPSDPDAERANSAISASLW